MQSPIGIVSMCMLLVVTRSISGHAIDSHDHVEDEGADQKPAEQRELDMESIFAGFAKSMIGRTGASSSQLLSLNLSNIVLMLVLKGLIWGASYMQGVGGGKGRKEGLAEGAPLSQSLFTETDMLLFLGYMVADESGHYDCLNRVACEQPARSESYLRSAEMVWKTAKLLDGVIPLDSKYEKMLIELQEAIEDGRANGDCQAKYKCSEPTNTEDSFNLI
ncbi:uncharacterized protein LOC112693651 isoform X2 [Sipha flava]|uniref:Uncharacterized protein LOC112693651 isoform X2 n=1 Tax=Sipha flava TaxID=143950 RepID=A0A8B8GPS2_9HEMI|nr:uncharacterized protein LOC112693651 isoform X2 [Sipha flava]